MLLRKNCCVKQPLDSVLSYVRDGWMGGWMDGWIDGQIDRYKNTYPLLKVIYPHIDVFHGIECVCVSFLCTGSRRNLVAMTRNKEKWRESSEDMNKGAGEMDEGSGERQERDRDGWSEELGRTGAQLGRETIHRCTEEIWERLWKNDKSRSWGRRDNEQRQKGWSVCLCAKGSHRGLEAE